MLEIGADGDQPVARVRDSSCAPDIWSTVSGISSSDEAKIGGMTPGGVELDRQVAALLLHRPARRLALGILHQHAALGALHEADEQDEADDQRR